MQKLERLSAESGIIKTDYSLVKVCSAPFGCPGQVLNPRQLMERLSSLIEKSGYREFLEENVHGPILAHHRFRISLSGCPNACSQPQIQDFGVIARAFPERAKEPCILCMNCVVACREEATDIIEGEPVIDYMECVGCSDCARACPTSALIARRSGYSIIIGGKLGRHPQLAQEIIDMTDEDGVAIALDTCLKLYMENMQGEERFARVVDRLGLDTFIQAVEENIRKSRS